MGKGLSLLNSLLKSDNFHVNWCTLLLKYAELFAVKNDQFSGVLISHETFWITSSIFALFSQSKLSNANLLYFLRRYCHLRRHDRLDSRPHAWHGGRRPLCPCQHGQWSRLVELKMAHFERRRWDQGWKLFHPTAQGAELYPLGVLADEVHPLEEWEVAEYPLSCVWDHHWV